MRRALLAVAMSVWVACGGDPAKPDVPPVVAVLSTTAAVTVSSGTGLQLAARYTDKRGNMVPGATVSWNSGDPTIATVSAAGLVTGIAAGSVTITATVDGTTGSFAVTVVPGAPTKLTLNTAPAGASSGALLTTQPVVQIRDAADNTGVAVPTTITASIGSGGGTLGGTVAVVTVQGVARFTDLSIAGTIGLKTLQFSAPGLTSLGSPSLTLQAGPPAATQLLTSPSTVRSGIAASVLVGLTDREGNAAVAVGRRVVATVAGGTGTTTIGGATAVTDALGRATFPALVVTGVAGARQLTFRADSTTTAAITTVSLVGGRPRSLAVERDAPELWEIGLPIAPPPIVRLIDSLGNTSSDARVVVRASVVGGSNTVTNDSVFTDSLGRATFGALTVLGSIGTRTLQFTSVGLIGTTTRSVAFAPPDTATPPNFITTSATSADTTQRVISLATPTSSVLPYVSARNAQNQPMGTAGVRWFSRDPSRATVGTDGRITGVRGGRTFIVAQANRNAAVADSLLVFVPSTATGPLVRATLPSYRIATDTFSIIIQVESRDGRPLTAADIEVAWPGNASAPYSPFTVSTVSALATGVVTGQIDRQDNVRVTWVTTTPVSGAVALIRLVCRVNQRNVGNQLVITLNQLLAGDLTDLKPTTSIYNPIVIIP